MPKTKQDDDTAKQSVTPDFLEEMGISPEEQAQMENDAYNGAAEDMAENNGLSGDQLKDAEDGAAEQPQKTKGEKAESDKIGKGYNQEDSSNKLKALFSNPGKRKKLIGGGIIGGGVAGVLVYFGMFFSGPFEFMQISQLMTQFHFSTHEDQGDIRTNRVIRYIRDPSKPQNVRLTYLGNKLANRFESKLNSTGIESNYTSKFGFGEGYTVNTKSDKFKGLSEEQIKQKLIKEFGVPEESIQIKDGTIKFDVGDNYRSNAKLSRSLLRSIGYSKINSWVGARMLNKRAGLVNMWHPLTKIDNKIIKAADQKIAWRTKRAATVNEGSSPTVEGATTETDKEGKPKETPDSRSAANSVNELTAEANQTSPTEKGAIESFRSSVAGKVTMGSVSIIGVGCMAKSVADTYDTAKQDKIVLPLIRSATTAIGLGAQVASGEDINTDDMANMSDLMYGTDSDGNKTGWSEAESIRANLGQKGGVKPSEALTNINKGTPFDFLTDGMVGRGLDMACSTVGSIVMLGFSFAAGPISASAGALGSYLFAGKIINYVADWFLGMPIDPFATGADYGSQVDFGSVLAANDLNIGSGGVALSKQDVAYLQSVSNENLNDEFASQNFAYRMFSTSDSRSLLSRMAMAQKTSFHKGIGSTIRTTVDIPAIIGSSFISTFSKVKADSSEAYDYGVEIYGFSEKDMEAPSVQNPYQNAKRAAALLDSPSGGDIISKASECFGVNIKKDSGNRWMVDAKTAVVTAYSPDYKGKGCSDPSDDWRTIRLFILDSEIMDNMACFEANDQESCQNAGIDDVSSSGGADSFTVATYNILHAQNHTPESIAKGNCTRAQLVDDPTCGKTRADLQIKIINGEAGNPKFDIIGTQETSPLQYDYIKNNLSGYDVFPDDASRMSPTQDGAVAIWWNNSKFTKTASGKYPGISNIGAKITVPWVELKSTSGRQVFVTSIHYATNGHGGSAENIRKSSDLTIDWVKSKVSDGSPVIVVGDFNDKLGQKLSYCVYTKDSIMQHAADMAASANPSAGCGNPRYGGIDHIYATPVGGILANGWHDMARAGIVAQASDHTPSYVTYSFPGEGTNNLVDGISWPVDKKYWDADKSDFLNAHTMISGTFTSPYTRGLAADISSPPLGAPVYSMVGGTVEKVGLCDEGGGMMIKSSIPGGTLHIAYGHGTSARFKAGDSVQAGDQILDLGQIGCKVSGPHLHIDMALNDKHICPQDVFLAMGSGQSVDFNALTSKSKAQPPCNRD